MRVGIDARFLTHPQVGGFKTYTENLISALARVDDENEYYLYLDRPPEENTKVPNKPNFSYHVVPGWVDMFGMVWREQFSLPHRAVLNKLDIFHSPCLSAPIFIDCATIVTIHDMIWYSPKKYPGAANKPKSLRRSIQDFYYRLIPILAAKKASMVITVSEASKKDIVSLLSLPSEKVVVTYEAAGDDYQLIDDQHHLESVLTKYDLTSKYILGLGSSDPRKNMHTLLEAYSMLPARDRDEYQLVIIWNHGFMAPSIEKQMDELGLAGRIRFLKGVSNDDLRLLYNAASLFVFPSTYEGFGLPLLEAMTCGTPVVAANNSSIPEIVETAALLTDAENAAAMGKVISAVLDDELLRKRLITKGIKRAAKFSWDECALQTIEVYKKVSMAHQPTRVSVERSSA